MRKTLVVALAAAVALSAGAARADKSTQAFVDGSSTGANGFKNVYSGNKLAKTYSTGSAKASGCKIKISFKGLQAPTANGDKLICLLGADACLVPPPGNCNGTRFGNTVVALVPWDGTLLKGGTKIDTGPIGCGGVDASAVNADVTCYRPNAAYSVNTNTPGSPVAQCAAQGGTWINNADFVPGEEGTDGLLGLCQWFVPGSQRLTGPGTGVVCVDGVSTPAPPP
jgi:hypothetical protein